MAFANGMSDDVSVIARGAFGDAVEQLLLARARAGSPVPPFLVVASWREDPQLFEECDVAAFSAATTFLPIVVEHPWIRIGPFVDGAGGPCYSCFGKRTLQHAGDPSFERELAAARELRPEDGVQGFTAAQVSLAAAFSLMPLRPGEYVRFHTVLQRVRRGRTVGAGSCQRCGDSRDDTLGTELDRVVGALRS
jgi:hypothetical protein